MRKPENASAIGRYDKHLILAVVRTGEMMSRTRLYRSYWFWGRAQRPGRHCSDECEFDEAGCCHGDRLCIVVSGTV